MTEIWLPIKGFENLYEISNMGKVKSLAREWIAGNNTVQRHKDYILTPSYTNKGGSGYLQVLLYDGKGHRYRKKIHKLVAEMFLEKPINNKLVLDHINGIKTDNRVENLRWVTHYENSVGNPNTPTTPNKPVCMKSLKGEVLRTFQSIKQAARSTHLNQANITHALTGRYCTCGGFKWEYCNLK